MKQPIEFQRSARPSVLSAPKPAPPPASFPSVVSDPSASASALRSSVGKASASGMHTSTASLPASARPQSASSASRGRHSVSFSMSSVAAPKSASSLSPARSQRTGAATMSTAHRRSPGSMSSAELKYNINAIRNKVLEFSSASPVRTVDPSALRAALGTQRDPRPALSQPRGSPRATQGILPVSRAQVVLDRRHAEHDDMQEIGVQHLHQAAAAPGAGEAAMSMPASTAPPAGAGLGLDTEEQRMFVLVLAMMLRADGL